MTGSAGLINIGLSRAGRLAGESLLAALLLLGLPLAPSFAQDAPPAADSAPASQEAEAPEGVPADAAFTQDELRQLLAPFALYPDALLAQLLPACAYPIDIVQAARWLDKNEAAVKKDDFSGADSQAWDPTVKALVRFPDIIQKLNADLDVTTDLGDAFVNQPEDVAAMIQTLRAEAEQGGSLKSTAQQTVTVQEKGDSSYIVIEPADPAVIYVPTYDPATVYYDGGSNWVAGAVGFGVGVAVGVAIDNAWDWGRGWVYPPRWPGYPGYRPGYPGYVGRPGNVNIGNDINIGGNNNINIGNGSGNMRPWRPDGDRYRPGQGSKPGLANRPGSNRPGTANRPGAANRPGTANRPGGGATAGGIKRPDAGGGKLSAMPDKGALAGKGTLAGKGGAVAGKKSGAIDKGAAKRPAAAKPATKAKPSPARKPAGASAKRPPKPTAFGDARLGGASKAMGQRGATSRKIKPPSGGGAVRRGGGGGGAVHRGGGGRGGHGGGRRR